jgi:hypothetical protein
VNVERPLAYPSTHAHCQRAVQGTVQTIDAN